MCLSWVLVAFHPSEDPPKTKNPTMTTMTMMITTTKKLLIMKLTNVLMLLTPKKN